MAIYGAIPRGGYKQQPRRIPRSLGFARYALSFDGVDDYVDCGNDASLNITGDITIEACFQHRTGLDETVRDAHYSGVGKLDAYELTWDGWANGWVFAVYEGGVRQHHWALDTHMPSGEWTRVSAVLARPIGSIYINGIHKSTTDRGVSSIDVNANPFRLSSLRGLLWNGLIAGVWVYNRALSAGERMWNMLNYHNPIRSGLVLWLSTEEGAGEVVYDKSGYGNNGTLLPAGAGPTWERLRQWELRAAVE